jgi:hypothetical protein
VWGRSALHRVQAGLAAGVLVATLVACTEDDGSADMPSAKPPAPSSQSADRDAQPGWIVSLGDSYISGEGARWGANGSGPIRRTDALGPDAYFDADGQESEPGCHRASRTVVVPRVAGLRGKNVACSGATTRSDSSGVRFKPGLDFAHESDGDGIGQTLALRRFAAHHRVVAVVVSIGGNDFGFGALAGQCVNDNLSWDGGAPPLCSDDADLNARFDPRGQVGVERSVTAALGRVTAGMREAGYADEDYRRVLMTYPSPIPPGSRLRYSDADRGRLGGCPFFALDADWANGVVLPAINHTVAAAARSAAVPFEVLDLGHAFDGHRLCETGTVRLSESDPDPWDAPGAVNRLEWVNQVYTTIAPHQIQESLHPGYWGTAAERACLRLVLTGSAQPSYRCRQAGPGLRDGDPAMKLTGD